MTIGNMLAWVVIGLAVGFVFYTIRTQHTTRVMLLDVVIGIFGGLIGGALLFGLGGMVGTEIIGVNIWGVIVAIIGAFVLDAILQMLLPTPEK